MRLSMIRILQFLQDTKSLSGKALPFAQSILHLFKTTTYSSIDEYFCHLYARAPKMDLHLFERVKIPVHLPLASFFIVIRETCVASSSLSINNTIWILLKGDITRDRKWAMKNRNVLLHQIQLSPVVLPRIFCVLDNLTIQPNGWKGKPENCDPCFLEILFYANLALMGESSFQKRRTFGPTLRTNDAARPQSHLHQLIILLLEQSFRRTWKTRGLNWKPWTFISVGECDLYVILMTVSHIYNAGIYIYMYDTSVYHDENVCLFIISLHCLRNPKWINL